MTPHAYYKSSAARKAPSADPGGALPELEDDFFNLVSDLHAAPIEEHLRAYLTAQAQAAEARATAKADQPGQQDDDEKWQRAADELAGFLPPRRIRLFRDFCLGSIGMSIMAPKRISVLGVVGSGPEAEAQLAAALRKRRFDEVRIYARHPVAAANLTKKLRNRSEAVVRVSASPEEAVHHAGMVILASGESRPDIDADWVENECYVVCAFPQTQTRNELPRTLLARAKLMASDSPDFVLNMPDTLMKDAPPNRRMAHLAGIVERPGPDRRTGITALLLSGDDRASLPVLKAMAALRQKAAM